MSDEQNDGEKAWDIYRLVTSGGHKSQPQRHGYVSSLNLVALNGELSQGDAYINSPHMHVILFRF